MRLSLRAEQAELVDEDEPVAVASSLPGLPDGWEQLTEGSAGRWFERTERIFVTASAAARDLAAACVAKDAACAWLSVPVERKLSGSELPPGWQSYGRVNGMSYASRSLPGGDRLQAMAEKVDGLPAACAAADRRVQERSTNP